MPAGHVDAEKALLSNATGYLYYNPVSFLETGFLLRVHCVSRYYFAFLYITPSCGLFVKKNCDSFLAV